MKANIWLHNKREQAYLDSGLVEVYRSSDATPSKAGILLHPALDTTTPQLSRHSSIVYHLIRPSSSDSYRKLIPSNKLRHRAGNIESRNHDDIAECRCDDI
jgi:hypothetical protein